MKLPDKLSETPQELSLKFDMLKDVQSRLSFLETRLDGCLGTIEELGMQVRLLEESLEEPMMEEES